MAEQAKEYRAALKRSPEHFTDDYQKNKEKCKQYRSKPLTEEQLAIRREKDKIQAQKYRDNKKTKNIGEIKAPPQKPKTRKAVEKQRAAWLQQKASQRERWTAQKWRRHRERCSLYMMQRRQQ